MSNNHFESFKISLAVIGVLVLLFAAICGAYSIFTGKLPITDIETTKLKEKNELTIEEPEQILFEINTSGEFAKDFKPQWFLRVTGTDLSRCLINNRLRISLDDKIYWVKVEEN